MKLPLRITATVPSVPSIHAPAIHTASSDVGIELPATWQQYQLPGQVTPHFGIMVRIQVVLPFITTVMLHSPAQVFYHFPSIYFQNFYGTFNI